MPRTAVAYSTFTANSSTADPAGTTIDSTLVTNGVKVTAAVPEETVIRVANTAGTSKVVTINAGDYPPAAAAGQGAVTGTVGATTGVLWFGPFESGRFLQNDGTFEVDFASGTTGTITVFRVPRTA
jgi:hypothetical protein